MMELLKNYANILIRVIVRLLMRVFYVFPIRKKRIFFESYYGMDYSCNPKYISEYLNKHYPNQYKIIWAFKNPERYNENLYFKTVKFLSPEYFLYRCSSRIVVINVAAETYIPVRRGQIILNTWHAGGAYKTVGNSVTECPSPFLKWCVDVSRKGSSVYLSSSETFSKFNIRQGYGFNGAVLHYGMPRNDFFFYVSRVQKAGESVRKHYALGDKIIVLYAPTYRGGITTSYAQISYTFPFSSVLRVLQARYKRDVVILSRSHHYGKRILNEENCLDVTDYPDMQELLAASDILITDYSSCMWDFALLGRPCFLYVPDMDEYNTDRGVYTPMETWPGFLCKSEKELFQALSDFTEEEAREKAKAHLDLFGSYETGHATEQVCEKIQEWMK